MQEESNKEVDLLSINRYKNIMRLVDTQFDKKIQALCRKLEMPHLSNYLGHKAMPKKEIGARMARKIECILSLPTRALDASPGHQADTTSEYVEDCHIKQARYENLLILLNLVSPGNISRFGDYLGCHVSNYLGAKRSRSVGDKVARKIETNLGLNENALDTLQSLRFFMSILSEHQLIECIEQFQAAYNDQLLNLKRLNEKQEQTLNTMLQRLAHELVQSTDYDLLAHDDVRKIFLPYCDKKGCLPVLIRSQEGGNWQFWVIGTQGMKTHFDKVTRHAVDGNRVQRAQSTYTPPASKISIVDPVNHNHENLPDISRAASLVIKRATYDLQDTVDEVMSLRMRIKQCYNALVDAQAHYILTYSDWRVLKLTDHYTSGLHVPIVTLSAHGQKLKAVLVPTMKADVQTKQVKEFIRRELRENSTLNVLPVQFQNKQQLGNVLLSAKVWLKHT